MSSNECASDETVSLRLAEERMVRSAIGTMVWVLSMRGQEVNQANIDALMRECGLTEVDGVWRGKVEFQ